MANAPPNTIRWYMIDGVMTKSSIGLNATARLAPVVCSVLTFLVFGPTPTPLMSLRAIG